MVWKGRAGRADRLEGVPERAHDLSCEGVAQLKGHRRVLVLALHHPALRCRCGGLDCNSEPELIQRTKQKFLKNLAFAHAPKLSLDFKNPISNPRPPSPTNLTSSKIKH